MGSGQGLGATLQRQVRVILKSVRKDFMEDSTRIRFVFQVTHSAQVRRMKARGWHRAKKTARGSCCHPAFWLKDGQEGPGSGRFRRKF